MTGRLWPTQAQEPNMSIRNTHRHSIPKEIERRFRFAWTTRLEMLGLSHDAPEAQQQRGGVVRWIRATPTAPRCQKTRASTRSPLTRARKRVRRVCHTASGQAQPARWRPHGQPGASEPATCALTTPSSLRTRPFAVARHVPPKPRCSNAAKASDTDRRRTRTTTRRTTIKWIIGT